MRALRPTTPAEHGGADIRTLACLVSGEHGVVHGLHGGHEMSQRLAEMGLSPGTPFRVIKGGGPVILECRGHRLIVGRGMADRLMVRKRDDAKGGA